MTGPSLILFGGGPPGRTTNDVYVAPRGTVHESCVIEWFHAGVEGSSMRIKGKPPTRRQNHSSGIIGNGGIMVVYGGALATNGHEELGDTYILDLDHGYRVSRGVEEQVEDWDPSGTEESHASDGGMDDDEEEELMLSNGMVLPIQLIHVMLANGHLLPGPGGGISEQQIVDALHVYTSSTGMGHDDTSQEEDSDDRDSDSKSPETVEDLGGQGSDPAMALEEGSDSEDDLYSDDDSSAVDVD